MQKLRQNLRRNKSIRGGCGEPKQAKATLEQQHHQPNRSTCLQPTKQSNFLEVLHAVLWLLRFLDPDIILSQNAHCRSHVLLCNMDAETAAQTTPLLAHGNADEQEIETKLPQCNELDVQFYDPNTILDVSKEMSLGYLVLLTGGSYEYKRPSVDNDNKKSDGNADDAPKYTDENAAAPQSPDKICNIDDQTSALAYAAITDGNVLHTCFGLKSGPNGRPNIVGEKQSSSIFCCFPSASAPTLQNLRSNKNRKDMAKLVDLLRDVKDLECGKKGKRVDTTVIQSYVQCFAVIVRYHDERALLQRANEDDSEHKSMLCSCSNFFASLSNMFSSKKSEIEIKVEELQKNSLAEINREFNELKLLLAEVQADVVSVAETGVTVDCKEDI